MSGQRTSWWKRLLGKKPAPSTVGGWGPPRPAASPPAGAPKQPQPAPAGKLPEEYEAEYREARGRGLRELAAGHVAEAIKTLGHAVHLRPDLAEAHLNMARAFQQASKIEAAREAYLRALHVEPTSAEARAGLAGLPPPPATRKDFDVGQVLRGSETANVYRVLQAKKGGFGAVCVVEDQSDHSLRVLKTFQGKYLWSDDDRERFEREALTWVMLDRHPNITTAFWAERIEGFPCLVLEYVAGGDLAQALAGAGLAPARALELALQFCDGMSYAHKKLGVVHRDVKPSNCLLAGDGTLKVTDFGLARAFGEAQEEALGLEAFPTDLRSQYTSPAGTLQYMAPEQFIAGAQLDTRTDIYGFGILLYQMLTCDLPPSGSVAQAYIRANASAHHVDQRLLSTILRCVEPLPQNRPGAFAELRSALSSSYPALTGRPAPAEAKAVAMTAGDWQNKGVALRALGHYQEAIACYDRGLGIAPRDSGLWNNKGVALRALGHYQEAIACYDRGLEIAPRESALWRNKGEALRRLARYQEAIACYDRGLGIAPRDSGLWNNKGLALRALGQHQEALACYDRGLEIAPRDSVLWNNKGEALRRLGRYPEAIACYDRGLEIAPGDRGFWDNKGIALQALGRTQEAEECLRRAREPGEQ